MFKEIIDSYFGLDSALKNYFISATDPSTGDPIESQRWHRDPEEHKMLKIFVYLTDVGENDGAFEYIPQSVKGKKWGKMFPVKPWGGSMYPRLYEVEQFITPEFRMKVTGKAGTIIFCDTAGLHRGGYSTENQRVMFTAFYTAPSYRGKF